MTSAVIGLILAATTIACADDAEESFKLLFGDRYEKATASAGVADDVALASEIIEAAKNLGGSSNVLAVFCDRAYLLGIKDPEGYGAAATALTLLGEHVPARAADAKEKLIELRQKSFVRAKPDQRAAAGESLIDALISHADALMGKAEAAAAAALYRRASTVAVQIKSESAGEIKTKLDAAISAERIEKQVIALRTKVLENATDHASAEQLVRLLVIDMDKPALAQPYANHVKDADLKKHMALATKPVDELAEAEAQSLGAWYRTQGAQAKEARAKAAMFARSAQCFERFLSLHTAEDLAYNTVRLTLEGVKKELAKLEEAGTATPKSPAATSKVIRLLNGKDMTGWRIDGKQNPWSTGSAGLDPNDPERFRVGKGGELICMDSKAGMNIATDAEFGDCVLELDFMIARGTNSGVYLMSQYEVQIWDAPPGNKVRPEQLGGAIYNQTAPRTNAMKAAGQWQKLVVDFRAPRFDKNGKKTAHAKFVKVILNGQVVHENVEVQGATNPALSGREAPTAPLTLQGTTGAIAFRDILIKPLGEK